jgi:hypothetical protein
MRNNKVRAYTGGMMTEEERKSGFSRSSKPAETLEFTPLRVGQSCPQQYPQLIEPVTADSTGLLGEPLDISQVAMLLGCSVWTVRQRYLPQGLPHLRACASGKLVFFREQVIGWILKRQQRRQKGGPLR